MKKRNVMCRSLSCIETQSTAHGIGLKRVLLANNETASNITQIAVTCLKNGERVEPHVHPSMDEHYFFERGEGRMVIDDIAYECHPGTFLLIPSGIQHDLYAITEISFITIGVAI